MRKWILIAVFALLVIVPVVLLTMLLYTPAGLTLIAGQLHRLEPLGVRIEGVSGTLLGGLRVARFELDHPSVRVVSHDIEAQLAGRELILQRITATSLTARDTLVEIRDAPDEPPPTKPLRFLPSFLRIDVAEATLSGVRYVNIDGTAVDANSVRGSVRIGPRRLRVRRAEIDAPQFQLSASGQLLAQRPLGLELRAEGNASLERDGRIIPIQGSAQVTGTIDQLAIQATTLKPDVVNLDGMFTRPQDQWRLQSRIASPAISLGHWIEDPPFSLRNIALTVDARPDGIHARGNIGVPEVSQRDFSVDVLGSYAQRVLEIEEGEIAVNDTPMRAQVSGSVSFGAGDPILDARARWTDLQWPLEGESLVASTRGEATVKGALPYEFALNAHALVPAHLLGTTEPIDAVTQASGSIGRDSLTLQQYRIETLRGTVAGSGSLQFAAPRRWSLVADASALDPSVAFAAFPGSLDFKLDARGEGFDKGADFSAHVARLAGDLRGQPVSGSGLLQKSGQSWIARKVDVRMGDAHLQANGTLDRNIDADVVFRSGSLQTFLPDARGSVELTASARGPVSSPRIITHLQARNAGYGGWQADSIVADADLDLAGHNPSQLSLKALQIGQKEPLIESLSISGNGVADQHRVDVNIAGSASGGQPAARATLQLDGRYADATWSGTMLATEIDDGREPAQMLAMKEAGTFLVSRERLLLEKLCVAIGNGQVCAEGRWQRAGPWAAAVSGYEIPLAVVLPPTGPETEVAGRIEGRIQVSSAPDKLILVDAGARIIDAAVIYRPPGADAETLQIGNGGLSLTATEERVNFSLGVQAFEDTFLYANAQIERNGSNDLLNLPLTGDLRARATDANVLPILVTEVDNAAGLLTANFDIRGTAAQPQVDGRIELVRGEFDSYRVNLALRDINLVADIVNNRLDFRGSGTAGEGRMQVDGRFAWIESELRGRLELDGQNLLIADLPEYQVVASPDLTFQIEGTQMNVTGEVLIPQASIKPVNLGGAVQASADAQYIGETEQERKGTYVVNSQVRIRMGDDVRVDAFGLQGRIVGAVGTTIRTGETPIGRGDLSVADGRYEAYGQKLEISRGRLLFDATPLEDPGLDIEAQRKIETITVGLNVRGTLKEPRLTFFSDPSMPQTSIVSYLLVGKGIDDMQSGDRATMASAKDTLTLQGTGLLAGQLGRQLGIEQVNVESTTDSGGETNTSLVLGKFLSPRLFVSYGISLTESINTFKMRYTISDKWILKLEAGEVQSADAEYTIER